MSMKKLTDRENLTSYLWGYNQQLNFRLELSPSSLVQTVVALHEQDLPDNENILNFMCQFRVSDGIEAAKSAKFAEPGALGTNL